MRKTVLFGVAKKDQDEEIVMKKSPFLTPPPGILFSRVLL